MAPAISTPVGPPPTTTNVSSVALAGSGSARARPARTPAASARRIANASSSVFSAGRVRGPVVVAEVGVRRRRWRRSGSRTTASRRRRGSTRRAARSIPHASASSTRTLSLAAQHPADRRGDVARRQAGRGHLIQQRLEDVVVVAVDQRHAHRRAPERLGGNQPAEAAADDHDMRGAALTIEVVRPLYLLGPQHRVYTSPPCLLENAPRPQTVTVETACPLDCPDGCSLSVTVSDGASSQIDGSHANPVDRRLHLREGAAVRSARLRRRAALRYPMVRSGAEGRAGSSRACRGSEALERVASGSSSARARRSGGRVHPAVLLRRIERPADAGQRPTRAFFRRLGASRLARTVCAAPTGAANLGAVRQDGRRSPIRTTRTRG